jgi:hypothetical protein
MPASFPPQVGKIQLFRGTTKLGDFSSETTAVAAALNDWEKAAVRSKYRLRYPDKELDLSTLARTVFDPDIIAPTAPVITASVVSSSAISVALTFPSTDIQSSIASYRLEYKRTVDSTWTLDSASLTAASFPRTISGLTASTAYDTRCRATDGASPANVGPFSVTSSATTSSAGGGTDADADWAIRSALPGTLKAVSFATVADVNAWRFTNETGAFDPTGSSPLGGTLVRFSAGAGYRSGKGALVCEEPTGLTAQPAQIWVNADPAVTSGSRTVSYLIPPGEAFVVTTVLKFSSAMLNPANWPTADAVKIIYLNSANQDNVLQVALLARFDRALLQVNNPNAGGTLPFGWGADVWYTYPVSASDLYMQPGSEYGTCLYPANDPDSPTFSGCFWLQPDVFYPLRMTVILGTAGGTDTIARVEVQIPGQRQWTTIYFRKNLPYQGFQGGNGYSAVALIARHEHKSSSAVAGMTHTFSDLTLARGTPTPPPKQTYYAATYATNFTPKRYEVIPGSTTGTIAAAWPGSPGNLVTYGGAAVDQENSKFLMAPGGHAIQSGANSVLSFDYMQNSCAWSRVMTGYTGSSGDFSTNGTGAFADGSRAHDHTYNTIWVGHNGSLYFPAITTGIVPGSGSTFWTTASWKWNRNDLANGRHGYTPLSRLWPGSYPFFNTMVSSCGCYDPVRRHVWFFGQDAMIQGPSGDYMSWMIDANDDSLAEATTAVPNVGGIPAWATVVPRLNILLVQMTGGALVRKDLSTHAWSTCTVANGSLAPTSTTESAHYVLRADQIIGRRQNDGANVRALTLPSAVNGTYTWALKSPVSGGVTPVEATEASEHHMYTKFNVVQDIGNGNAMLIFTPTNISPTYGYLIDGPL